ncbi:MAG TPA: hypothetical protein VHV83_03270 [Armatimonadota bacterium]|nr:hypothetical protein [Armatimonadota bacterium]
MMKITCDAAAAKTWHYAPPVLGNGALSLLVDYHGAQRQHDYYGMQPAIWWAGRRYDNPGKTLVPFGHFDEEISIGDTAVTEPVDWQQSLDTDHACVESHCAYAGGLSVDSTVFVHLAHNVIAIRKSLHPGSAGSSQYRFTYQLAQPGTADTPPYRMDYTVQRDSADGTVDIQYAVDGQEAYHGIISLFADTPMDVRVDGNSVTLSCTFEEPTTFVIYLVFADSVDASDFPERSRLLKQQVHQEGFSGLRESHENAWAQYWAESTVSLPWTKLQEVYDVAQYHLRCSSTPWSMPIAILPTHWHGRYFAFDEFFSYLALAGSNHMAMVKRIVEFRHATLGKAMGRTLAGAARYPWETLENGEEGTPPGFWMDHVFHMASIALEAWWLYRYTLDAELLASKGYPIIKACAEFFRQHMVYEVTGGRTIVGKCTDFERLGAARENAYCTTCSVIAALEAAAEAATVVGAVDDTVESWRTIAQRLRQSLPQNEQQYLPYPGCEQKSIGVLGGLYPYTAISVDDEKQRRAIDDFCSDSSSGNMYAVGQSVCAWYAAWMMVVYARFGDEERVSAALQRAVDTTGCFSELFEINEPTVVFRPWFSTAEGTFIQGVHEMLLYTSPDEIVIAPAVPVEWETYAFTLRCDGDMMVEAKVDNRKLQKLAVYPGEHGHSGKKTIVVPSYLYDGCIIEGPGIDAVTHQDGQVRITLSLSAGTGDIMLIGHNDRLYPSPAGRS